MSLFSWLIVGHFVGDYLLQNRWMADGKTKSWLPLFVHSAVYTLVVTLSAMMAGQLAWPAIGLIFAAHLVLDRRGFVEFWARHVMGASDVPWLVIMVDQSWHLVVLALAVYLTV